MPLSITNEDLDFKKGQQTSFTNSETQRRNLKWKFFVPLTETKVIKKDGS